MRISFKDSGTPSGSTDPELISFMFENKLELLLQRTLEPHDLQNA
jgi:hypothetical protein